MGATNQWRVILLKTDKQGAQKAGPEYGCPAKKGHTFGVPYLKGLWKFNEFPKRTENPELGTNIQYSSCVDYI